MPSPQPTALPVRSSLRWGALGVAAWAAFRLASLVPAWVEVVYGRGVGPVMTWTLSTLTSAFPLALAEWVVVGYLGWWVAAAVRAVIQVVRQRRTARAMAVAGGLRVIRHGGFAMVMFYLAWGFNYARPTLPHQLTWPAWAAPTADELQGLARDAVRATNAAYRAIHDTTDVGHPTPMPEDRMGLDRALERGWHRVADDLPLPDHTTWTYPAAKQLTLAPVVARLGISGFFFPWTGEANVLRDAPAVARPQSMAHEKAHQRGVGPEAEAGFLGFLAGRAAPHAHARYAAWQYAQGHLLRALRGLDPAMARDIAREILPGVRRDLDDLRAFWAARRGVGSRVGRAVNDRYLRANRVEGGIASYGRTVRLLIVYARETGSLAAPDTSDPRAGHEPP